MSGIDAQPDRQSEDTFAREVAERLVPRLGGRVPQQTIEEEARQTYRSISQGARIHDFIPILGERDVFLRFRDSSA
ncbi:MAG: DUF3562 domain-containing protein [Actinobacteria bacterium]|nr:MAG: DUF3562 domain-containing protein [Actinomycetota bacterium]